MFHLIRALGHIGRAAYHYQRLAKDTRDLATGHPLRLIVRHLKGRLIRLISQG